MNGKNAIVKNITIGNDVYINFGCVILDYGQSNNRKQHPHRF